MEVWKAISDFEGYEVSNFGNVRRKPTISSNGRYLPRKQIKPYLADSGYMAVTLTSNTCRKTRYIHILVARAFCKNDNWYKDVSHKDGNKLNNMETNLEWCELPYDAKQRLKNIKRKSQVPVS